MLRYSFPLVLLCGCGPPSVAAPKIDAASSAAQAISEFDLNHDGAIGGDEFDKAPGLKATLERADKDADGRLSEAEITARLDAIRKMDVAMMPFECIVFLNGQPLVGAEVKLVPETYLASAAKPATGTTDARGSATFRIEGEQSSGVNRGIYRVEISKKDSSGRETIPAKYNSQTVLGQEIVLGIRDLEHGVKYNLDAK